MRFAAVILLAACGSAPMHTISFVNHSPRAIEKLYVYPLGAADHGASRARLEPEGRTQIAVRQGNIEILAVSAKVALDERTRDQPSATQAFELTRPIEIVFYDVNAKPAGLERPGVIGVGFTLLAPPKPPEPAP